MLRAAFRDVCVWVPILFSVFFLGQGFFYSSQLLFFRIEVIGNDARTERRSYRCRDFTSMHSYITQ